MENLCSEKNPDKAEVTIKQLREQKKLLEKKIAEKNSKSILSGTFDFDPEYYLDKSLLFDLKKTSDNDIYYIEHREGTNAFRIRKDEKQVDYDKIIKLIGTID